MLKDGFKINECDKYIYVKDTENGYVILCLYVIYIVGSDDNMVRTTKAMLNSKFDMKDMGFADMILGMKIMRTSNDIILSQTHYVDKILAKFSNDDTSKARTPMDMSLY